nr:hypothetical protein [Tanacetum cinerariifolium]
ANYPALWDVLKRKFEKSSISNTSCKDGDFHSQHHDEHQEDDAPSEGEKRAKRHNTSKSSKSARGSSSKRSAKMRNGLCISVMYLVEIVKFCDATLEKVLKEVKLRIFQNELWKKPPLLGELDLDIMKAYEREITKCLRHRGQMRRCESFVNERPILPTMERL